MLVSRDQLNKFGGVPGYSRECTKQTIANTMSVLVTKYGVTPFKDDAKIKHRGAKVHLYDVHELIISLGIFNRDHLNKKRYLSSHQKKVVQKLILELREYKLNSIQDRYQKYFDIKKLKILERLIKKASGSGITEYETKDDYCCSRSTATQGISHIIKLNDNRLRWESKTGKQGRYDFKTNREANLWFKENIIKKGNI